MYGFFELRKKYGFLVQILGKIQNFLVKNGFFIWIFLRNEYFIQIFLVKYGFFKKNLDYSLKAYLYSTPEMELGGSKIL